MPTLFDPIRVGDLDLPNRILMSPMTRLRATTQNIPTRIMQEYYTQRASAGLIIAEATPVSPMGIGYAQVAGIWSVEQTEAWKPMSEGCFFLVPGLRYQARRIHECSPRHRQPLSDRSPKRR